MSTCLRIVGDHTGHPVDKKSVNEPNGGLTLGVRRGLPHVMSGL